MAGPVSPDIDSPDTTKLADSPGRNSLVKSLASTSKKVREKGFSTLVKWLQTRKEIQDEDLKRLWKGLFYCFWHTDKVDVQADVAKSMASIVQTLNPVMSLRYFEVFLVTMGREWPGIDRLRMDKFCLLVRFFINSMFSLLSSHQWSESLVADYMETLKLKVLLGDDRLSALGLKLHLMDIYLEELWKVCNEESMKIFSLLEPFCFCLQKSMDKRIQGRLHQAIFSKLVTMILEQSREPSESNQKLEKSVSLEDVTSVEALLFSMAASPETPAGNRKALYSVYHEFKALEGLLMKGKEKGEGEHEEGREKARGENLVKKVTKKGKLKEAAAMTEDPVLDSSADVKEGSNIEILNNVEENGGVPKKNSKKNRSLENPSNAESSRLSQQSNGGSAEDLVELGNKDLVELGNKDLVELGNKRKKENLKKEKKKSPKKLKLEKQGDVACGTLMDNAGAGVALEPGPTSEPGTEGVNLESAESERADSQLSTRQLAKLATKLDAAFESVREPEKAVDRPSKSLAKRRAEIAQDREKEGVEGGRGKDEPDTAADTEPNPDPNANPNTDPNTKPKTRKSPKAKVLESPKEDDDDAVTPPQKRRKKVTFVLDSNLYFPKNGPVPPPAVRTPPSSRPRGSALKFGTKPGPINRKRLTLSKTRLKKLYTKKATTVKS